MIGLSSWMAVTDGDGRDVNIGDLRVGQMVTTTHPLTMRTGRYPVTEVTIAACTQCIGIELDDGRLLVGAPEQEVWVLGDGWRPLIDLWTGTRLVGVRPGIVKSTWVPGSQMVARVEVDNARTLSAVGLLSRARGAP